MREEISLLEYWNILKVNRKVLVIAILFVTLVFVIYGFVAPKKYQASATIMPLGGGSSGGIASVAGQLSGVVSMLGLQAGTSSSNQIMVFLKSRTMGEVVVRDNDLIRVFFGEYDEVEDIAPFLAGAISRLRRVSSFSEDPRTRTVIISVEHENPRLAARLVTSYLENLSHFIRSNTSTVAKKNRLFIEEQLENSKKQLLEVGKELSLFYEERYVSSVIPVLDVPLGLKKESAEKLQKRNGELQKTKKVLLEDLMSENSGGVVEKVPQQVYLEYLTLQREILTDVNTLLSRQYELAKIEEVQEEPAFQVIDPPHLPTSPSKPNRKLINVLGFFIACFSSVFFVFFKTYLNRCRGEKKNA